MIRQLDTNLFLFINDELANGLFDVLMPFVTDKSYFLLVPVILWIVIKDRRKALLASVLSLFSLIFADWIVHSLKLLIERPRPFMELDDVRLLVGRGKSFSMPSGHAANAFAVIIPLITVFGGFVRPFLLSGALLVGFSRVYIGVHYPSDVIVGITIGIVTATLVMWLFRWSLGKFKEASFSSVLLVFIALISLFRIYYIYTGPLDLIPDEAHYWDWSRRLDLSYYSKGPVVAYIIAAGRLLLGDTVFSVRIGAVILSALSSIMLFSLVRSMFDGKTALYAALLIQCIPLYAAYGIIMTIDAPFVFFWITSLYLVWIILERVEGEKNTVGIWVLLGISVGMGLLSKYTMAFFYICMFIYMISEVRLRGFLRKPHPYLAFLSSAIVFLPVIIWNSGHDWVTFKHTAGHAGISSGFVFSFTDFLEFWGSQLGVVTPVLFTLIWIAVLRMRRDIKGKFLLWFALPVFAFFMIKSIQGKVQANWAMTAYITGIIAFTYYYVKGYDFLKKNMQYLISFGIALSFALTVIAHYIEVLNLPPHLDPSERLIGWNELGKKVSEKAERMKEKGDYFIFSNKYQITSELAFYVEGNPVTYCANTGRRMNQYDLWPGFEDLIHYNAIFVMKGDQKMPESLENAFEGCNGELFSIERKGITVKQFSIFECVDFQGIERPALYSF